MHLLYLSGTLHGHISDICILRDEILGSQLHTLHNLHFYVSLMRGIRRAICDGNFAALADSGPDISALVKLGQPEDE